MQESALGKPTFGQRRKRGFGAVAATIALVAVALPVCSGLSIAQKEERHHEIDRLEDAWRSAVIAGNAKVLDGLLADDYMAITPSGTIQTKDDTLQSFRAGRFHITTLTMSDRKVRFYGATAVVTSVADIQATTSDGPLNGSYRYTRVYVRNTQGQWKIVSFEASQMSGSHKRNEPH